MSPWEGSHSTFDTIPFKVFQSTQVCLIDERINRNGEDGKEEQIVEK